MFSLATVLKHPVWSKINSYEVFFYTIQRKCEKGVFHILLPACLLNMIVLKEALED